MYIRKQPTFATLRRQEVFEKTQTKLKHQQMIGKVISNSLPKERPNKLKLLYKVLC